MIILSIKYLNRKQICEILLDNGEILSISMDLVIKHELSKAKVIDDVKLAELKREQRIIEIKRAALNYISYKPRTEKQVTDKLKILRYFPNEIEACIKFLKDFGYLNDELFAEKYIKDYTKRKSPSKKKLQFELSKKGIPKDIINKQISKLYNDEDEINNAKMSIEKIKYKLNFKNELEKKKYLYSYLSRQGFNYDLIRTTISEFLSEGDVEY